MPDRVGKPPLEVCGDLDVATHGQPARLGLALSLLKPILHRVSRPAGEELLATVWHPDVGDPAPVLQWLDRAVAKAAALYSWPRHGVDILPSTRTQWKALHSGFRVRRLVLEGAAIRIVEQVGDEGLEVALQDAPRPANAHRSKPPELHLLVDVRAPDREAPRRLVDSDED